MLRISGAVLLSDDDPPVDALPTPCPLLPHCVDLFLVNGSVVVVDLVLPGEDSGGQLSRRRGSLADSLGWNLHSRLHFIDFIYNAKG